MVVSSDSGGSTAVLRRQRIGLVVPPANPTVEPEVHALLDAAVDVFVARFEPVASVDLQERLRAYRDSFSHAAHSLAGLHPDVLAVGCTGCFYELGQNGEHDWCVSAARRHGCEVVTAAGAVCAVLRRLGARRVAVVSPYPQWLTEQATKFVAERGTLDIADLVQIDNSGDIYGTANTSVIDSLSRAGAAESDAVLLLGTGARALDVISGIDLPIPVISSNIALATEVIIRTNMSSSTPERLPRVVADIITAAKVADGV